MDLPTIEHWAESKREEGASPKTTKTPKLKAADNGVMRVHSDGRME